MEDNTQKEKVIELVRNDLVKFGQLFLPGDFMKSEPAPFHDEVGNLLLDRTSKRKCLILPRGHTKTTMMKASILHNLCFNPSDRKEFIAWVSEEQSQAVDNINYIKNHIMYNPALQTFFPHVTPGNKWTEKEFTTGRGDRIIAKGTTQRLRGRTEMGLRYTGIILDDFESELNTKTEPRRREIKEWVMSTVDPALENKKGKEGVITLIGTIVHYDSFLQTIYDGYLEAEKKGDPYAWEVIFKRAETDGKPLWESYFPIEKLNEIRSRYESLGLPHKYSQEYLNDARDISKAKFNIQKLNYYTGSLETRNGFHYLIIGKEAIPINIYLGVDLAYEEGDGHDFQVILVLGVDSESNWYILDYYRDHAPLYNMPSKIHEYALQYAPVKRVNIEKVGAQGIIVSAVKELSSSDRKMMPGATTGVPVPTRISKEDKIEAGLCKKVNMRKVYLKKEVHGELVNEMFEFPKGHHDDLLDAFWNATWNASSPKSEKFPRYEIASRAQTPMKRRFGQKKINWMTGLAEKG